MSSFAKFRKYQKPGLAILGVLCMISFIFSDLNCFYRGFGGGTPNGVAKTNEGTLTESDMDGLRRARVAANQFVDHLIEQVYQIRLELKRFGPAEEENVLETRLLAAKAEQMGITVNDQSINDFINEQVTEFGERYLGMKGRATTAQIQNAIRATNLTEHGLFAVLRTEILARKVTQLMSQGTETPAERWELFQRGHRRIQAEALAIPVSHFFDKFDPKEEELQAYFERYAEALSDPTSPEPGFKLHAIARFQYVTADYNKFFEQAKATVTSQEIEERYNKKKENYPYLGLSAPPDGVAPASDPTEPPKPIVTGPLQGPPLFAPRAPTGGIFPGDPFRPILPEGTDDKPKENTPDEGAGSKKEESPCGDQDAAKQGDEPDKRANAGKPADSGKTGDTVAPGEKSSTSKADEERLGLKAILSQYKLPRNVRDGSNPKTSPLWAVEDDIRKAIARERADKVIDAAFVPVTAALKDYQKAHHLYLDKKGPQPAPFEVARLPEGMTMAAITPWYTQREFAKSPLGQLRVPAANASEAGINLLEEAYQHHMAIYEPVATARVGDAERHLVWKTGDRREDRATSMQDDYIPGGPKVRDEVLRLWKLKAAREVARKHAEKIAEQARSSNQSLTQVQEAGQKGRVLEPFTWIGPDGPVETVDGVERPGDEFMRTAYGLAKGGIGVAMNAPQDTVYVVRVTGSEYVTHLGDNTAFVVPEEVARSSFTAAVNGQQFAMNRPFIRAMQEERYKRIRAWIDALKKEAGLVWIREPRRGESEG